MNKVKRDNHELEQALTERIENIRDYIADYKAGKRSRLKDIAVNLRALLIKTRTNTPLLFNIASAYKIILTHDYAGPPIIGRKPIYTLEELLKEISYASNVPTSVSLTYEELVKAFADQIGAHEDHELSEPFHRIKNSDIYINNVSALELTLIQFAEILIHSSEPIIKHIREK